MYTDKNFIAKDFIIVLVTDEASFREASHPPPLDTNGKWWGDRVRFCPFLLHHS